MIVAILALLVSIGAAAGSLYLSLGMDLKACALCFYQRAFAFGLVGVLASGVLAFRNRGARVCTLGLPLALAGVGVAGFHVWLGWTAWPREQTTWYLACPPGVEGLGTAPQQSLAAFALISLLLLIGSLGEIRVTGEGGAAFVVAVLLGAGAAAGSILANPPMPEPKPLPATPLQTCQPTLR
jgi:disulfide bond formation protein DsbB